MLYYIVAEIDEIEQTLETANVSMAMASKELQKAGLYSSKGKNITEYIIIY